MHIETPEMSLETLLKEKPVAPSKGIKTFIFILLGIGFVSLIGGYSYLGPKLFWGTYFASFLVVTGLAAGSLIIPAILQVTGAVWGTPVRRLAEANVAFLPVALILFCISFFGREYLYPWASQPFPGREWWMQPYFAYGRIIVLLILLFFLMHRFVKLNLRADIGFLREKGSKDSVWQGDSYSSYVSGWKGSDHELPKIQEKLAYSAPVLIICYAVIYSLFCFEFVMSMDVTFYSNLFGAFNFVGNIFMGFAVLHMATASLASRNQSFQGTITNQQYWDIGKLTFAFTMLWGYMFWSQFLPLWYVNVPETSQWLILRTREYPWKALGYITFTACFVFPFVTLLSRDIKRTPKIFAIVATIIIFGVWSEKYMLIMPSLSPERIPLTVFDIGIFLGFIGLYLLSVQAFMTKFPFINVTRVVRESPLFPKEEH